MHRFTADDWAGTQKLAVNGERSLRKPDGAEAFFYVE